ncbi:MAG: hypothetical protein J0L86_05620 [Flavobacteriales bacterium]|nr:hypothetical protein [Flavobacteriales bacterium]
MSFLKQYSSIDIQIKSAKEFLENGILYDYAVGKSPEGPCIMKTTTDGSVVWKKEYRIDGWISEFTFHEIIQSKLSNGQNVYFLYATDNQDHFIISIDSNGNYIKIKQIKLVSPLGVFLVESKITGNFYLAFSGLYEGNENTYGGNSLRQLMILEFDTDIEIINKNYYFTGSASDMLLNSVKSYLNGLLVVFDHKAGKTHLLDINYDLSVKLHKEIHVGEGVYSNFFSHDLIIVSSNISNPANNKYIVSGRNGEGKVLLLSFDGNQQNYIYEVPQSVGLQSNMILVNNELYLNLFQSNTEKQGSVIHKLNVNSFSNFSIVWSKTFKIGKFFYGIKRLIKSNYNPVFIYPSFDESLLFDSSIDLTTCITVALNYSMPTPISFDVINRETGVNEISYETFPINFMNVGEKEVSPKNICEFALDPNPDGPCVKDELLCDLYSSVLSIFTNCLTIPTGEYGSQNFTAQVKCFEQILSLIYDFDKKYPAYELLLHFENQISTISSFIGSPTVENYQLAYSSLQSILDYLLNLGNCNCGNDLEITNNSMLQSGHLYLQSAGSVGQESTKGIHLRWALKGALMEHLPKANYATTTFNFNKANDFVKIYRAQYVEYKVVLDFSLPPLQVNEIGVKKTWIYQVGDKIFHVHFKDVLKYNQIRATFNPNVEPNVFIKNYGSSLIEIENRTQLSFKVTPNFIQQNAGDSIKLEALSVQENKITAPKTVSIRKQFTVSELNGNPLIAENIRGIRFVSTNAFIGKVAFEFYSDFVSNVKTLNGWNYLGQYALTKETDLAFQRLEPQANCLQNWLRYNDDAYVNKANYQNKWNGNDLAELDKIATSVERYISLSDSVDNIRAIEIFPFESYDAVADCNIQDPDYDPANPSEFPNYDPYIADPTTETGANNGIEISYLNVLQFGSLDYHIARMLGLGTLDLNTVVFSGQYIYMAEYVSLGDLNDGLGAREVQHLYCSLPTSLTDQRLSLPVNLKEIKEGVFFNTGYDGTEVDNEDDEGGTIPPGEQIPSIELTTDGYSPDGKTKYYTLYTEEFTEELFDAPFYYIADEFVSSEFTTPVFAGLEYRTFGTLDWNKPELSHSDYYYNVDTSGIAEELKNETIEFIIPEAGQSLYTHGVKETGVLEYCSYGVNWFSRATVSDVILQATTVISPKNELLPPTNVNATLIQQESPLLLTTSHEQFLYGEIDGNDKTLVRLTFDYNHAQELINYHQKINGEIVPNYFELENDKELFADTIQIYFRDQIPNSVSGKIESVIANSNPLLITIETSPYVFASTGESIIPTLDSNLVDNFIGSILLVGDVEYVIHQIDISSTYPKFTVFKSDASGALVDLNTVIDPMNPLQSPSQGDLFVVVENMLNLTSWGSSNPSSYEITIDHVAVHREDEIIIKNTDCSIETHVQKFRGVYQQAEIHKIFENVDENEDGEFDTNTNGALIEKHLGLYKIIFPGFSLEEHSMNPPDANGNFVEFYNGIARLHTLSDIGNEPRKNFKVIRTENIGTTNDLILYVEDLTFPTDLNELDSYKGKLMLDEVNSTSQMVNYYPSYKVYLYKDTSFGLTKENVLPQGEDDVRYTIFGLRSRDSINQFSNDFYSKVSVPTLMFAQAIAEPVRPELPIGGMYATRPDFFGKASYTFTTKYGTPTDPTKPYSVQFNRASDIQFLTAIYDNSVLGYDEDTGQPVLNTVQNIIENIFLNGEEEFYVNRWNDLLNFEVYPNGEFSVIDGKQLPLPNNTFFIASINAFVDAHNDFYQLTGVNAVPDLPSNFNLNTIVIPATPLNSELRVKDFMKDVLLNCFVPLTEIPVLYNYVKGQPNYFPEYSPIPKKQVVRDRNGNLLKPDDLDFDMAPMMKRIDTPNAQYESQFTDFGLDGASNAKYFYAVREINNQMKTSPYSEILGPISLVNTAPPVAPQILKVMPVLENRTLGILPAIQLQINSYPKPQNIAKISIYRTDNPNDALLVRTMSRIKVIDLEVENLVDQKDWIFTDDFSDLVEVPYGDTLYYRVTVSRVIRYNNKALETIVEYTPSEASRLIVTNITENYSPVSPVLKYTAGVYNASTDNVLDYITLNWEENVYKGNYHLYKMNSQGNWVEIIRVIADRATKGLYYLYNQDPQGNWVNTIHTEPLQSVNGVLYLPLELTNLATSSLATKTIDDQPIYHHFKVISENTAGMFSKQENILTMYNAESYQSDNGIRPDTGEDGMIIQGNFVVRPN